MYHYYLQIKDSQRIVTYRLEIRSNRLLSRGQRGGALMKSKIKITNHLIVLFPTTGWQVRVCRERERRGHSEIE